MAINPEIALQVKPMQINDPLETAGKVLSIRGAQQNQALGAQQLQAGALHLQQQQMEMADQQTLRQALIANKGDREAALQSVVGKINPATYAAGLKSILDQKKELGELDKQKREALDFQLGKISDALAPVLQAPPEQKAAVYQQGIGFLKAHGVDTSQMNPEYTNDEDIQASLAHANGYLKMSEEVRKQAEEKRAAAKAPVELTKLGAEATAAQQKATGTEPIQPFQTATLEGQAETRAQTASHNTAMEANAERLRKIAEGNLAVSQEHADIARKVFDQTYGEGANPALVGVEPKLRVQAAGAAQKAADEYTKAMESTANVQTFIEMAKKGNKAAGSNLPIMGAESIQALNGIRRINRTEIEQYQGAGSLLDKIQGRIGKLATGQPIPADVMKDIEDLHKAISGNAATNYNTKLEGINQNYHAQFKPVAGAHAATASGAIPEITSQADYDKLPKGAKYTNNGVPHVKQ